MGDTGPKGERGPEGPKGNTVSEAVAIIQKLVYLKLKHTRRLLSVCRLVANFF